MMGVRGIVFPTFLWSPEDSRLSYSLQYSRLFYYHDHIPDSSILANVFPIPYSAAGNPPKINIIPIVLGVPISRIVEYSQ